MPPLIGISTSEMRSPERTHALAKSEPPTRELALGMSYPRSIELAGAVPVVIPPLDDHDRIDALLRRMGGLVLSGGPDVHPAAYGEEPHPALGPTEPDLDAFEIALVRRADALGMPILGICRGLQVLNVARGGALIQDIPDHRQEESGRVPTHTITLKEGSLLEQLMGPGEHGVNSFHHQAARRLGLRLEPVAWSPDGIVEGLEAVDRDFVLGVQWHVESMSTQPDQEGIYEAFLAAARRFEAGAGRAAAA